MAKQDIFVWVELKKKYNFEDVIQANILLIFFNKNNFKELNDPKYRTLIHRACPNSYQARGWIVIYDFNIVCLMYVVCMKVWKTPISQSDSDPPPQ